MFPLSPYQTHTVRSMNPAPLPPLRLLPLNNIPSQRCESREENMTTVIENALKCSFYFSFAQSLGVGLVIHVQVADPQIQAPVLH